MSEEDWTIVPKPTVTANKWDDEEDDDVKENWDDEDEEPVSKASSADASSEQKPPPTEPKEPGAKKKKQKALKDKLLQKDLEMSSRVPRTKEEILADKLERQRLQEESDLNLAKEAFGVDSNGVDTSALGSIQLATRADFEAFRKALSGKLSNYTRSPYYVPFLEELFRELATEMEADDIKKLDTVLTTIFNEKIKLQKQASKGKKAKKANATIQMERDDDYSYNQSAQYDDFDDFI